jgi:hypothetical protein
MYCPKCRTEYQDGFTICAECNVPLMLECPPEPTPEYQEYVTVSVGSNVVRLAAAKAALDDAGIPSVTVGDSFRDLFALIGNPLALQVLPEHADEARRLLADLDEIAAERAVENDAAVDSEDETRAVPVVDDVQADAAARDDLVTVMVSDDITRLAEARDLLNEQAIQCVAKGDTFHDLFALLQQLVALQVPREHADEARKLLADLDEFGSDMVEEDQP